VLRTARLTEDVQEYLHHGPEAHATKNSSSKSLAYADDQNLMLLDGTSEVRYLDWTWAGSIGGFLQETIMCLCKRTLVTAIGGIALSAALSTACADFVLESQNLSIDQQTHAADFSLTFNQSPDFTTLNSQGQPVNSFQIDFNGNYPPPSKTSFLNSVTGVVRGDEIHIAGDIPIRSATGNGGPNSGGWGPAVDSVPFSLIGDTVSFSVPTKDLGWTGHSYKYLAFSLSNGTQTASQSVTMVPTPAAFPAGVVGLIVMAGATFVIRRRSAQRTG